MTTALQLFKTAMEEQPDEMADYFGDAYAQVQQLYANLQVNTTYKGRLDRDDLAMMDNMNFVLRQYPDDKFFGQLSNGHVTQSAWKDGNYIANYSRFGMLLNGEGSPVQGKVCSMLTIYTQRGSSGLLGDDARERLLRPERAGGSCGQRIYCHRGGFVPGAGQRGHPLHRAERPDQARSAGRRKAAYGLLPKTDCTF